MVDPYTALTIGKSVMGFIDANNQKAEWRQ